MLGLAILRMCSVQCGPDRQVNARHGFQTMDSEPPATGIRRGRVHHSPYFSAQKGVSTVYTVGIAGEVVYGRRRGDRPLQGPSIPGVIAGTSLLCGRLRKTLCMNSSIDTAEDESPHRGDRVPQVPPHARVVGMRSRRGIPSMPRKCIGKKVILNPMKVSQKWSLPRVSPSMRPVILGHQ